MKSFIFAIAVSSLLLSLYTINATSSVTLEEICSKTDFSNECSSGLANFMTPGNNIDANAVILAGLKALEAETSKAVAAAEKLLKENPTGKAAEELTVGMATYSVVSNCTVKAQEAIQANNIEELKNQIKLSSKVTGDLLDTFQVVVEGENNVMKGINIYIHQLAQINFNIVMKTHENEEADQQKDGKKKEDEKEDDDDDDEEEEDEDDDDDDDEEEEEDEDEEEEEKEESASAPGSAPVSSPMGQPPM